MRSSISRSHRLVGTMMMIAFGLAFWTNLAKADEWEGTWAGKCSDKGSKIILSRSEFDLSTIEMQCAPVGVRKLGSRYIVDLSCDGEGGAQRMRVQIEVKNDLLTISGIPANLGQLHRCASE